MPNTADDVVVNKYVTDHWQQPNASQDPRTRATRSRRAATRSGTSRDRRHDQFAPKIGPNCLEVPLTGQNTKDGAFDGGYAFADYCPDGYDLATELCNDGSAAGRPPAGRRHYITHAIMPKDTTDTRPCNPGVQETQRVTETHGAVPGGGDGCLYRIVREEDVNVDLGNQFTPQIPPPPCTGDDHVIDQCDADAAQQLLPGAPARTRRCATSSSSCCNNQQNANADFYMMTNFRTDPNGEDASDARTGDVAGARPRRRPGLQRHLLRAQPGSTWYGEPRPIANIPVGIYARVGRHGAERQPAVRRQQLAADQDGDHERRRRVRGAAALDRDAQLPDPARPVPRHVHRHRRRPRHQGTPERQLQPEPAHREHAVRGLAGTDRPARHARWTRSRARRARTRPEQPGPARPPTPARPELLQVSTARTCGPTPAPTGASPSRATSSARPAAGDDGWTAASPSPTTAPAGHDARPKRSSGGIVELDAGQRHHPGHDRHPGAGHSAAASHPAPSSSIITANATTAGWRVQRQRPDACTCSVPTDGNVTYNPRWSPCVRRLPDRERRRPRAAERDRRRRSRQPAWSPAGVYDENILLWKPLKLQGRGPGGIIGSHELQARDPEDPRFNIPGTVVDGRYFQQNAPDYDAAIAAHSPYAGVTGNGLTGDHPVLRGADVTVLAKSTTAYDVGTGRHRVLRPGPHRRHRPDHRPGRRRRRHPAAGVGQQHPAHQQRAGEQRRRRRRRHRPRPAVRRRPPRDQSQPQLQRADRQRPGDRQRRPDPGRRHRDLLRLQRLRVGQQHRLLELQRELRRRRLPHRAQPGREDPRQPDLLQRLGRLAAPASRSRPSCRSARRRLGAAAAPSTWTAT